MLPHELANPVKSRDVKVSLFGREVVYGKLTYSLLLEIVSQYCISCFLVFEEPFEEETVKSGLYKGLELVLGL